MDPALFSDLNSYLADIYLVWLKTSSRTHLQSALQTGCTYEFEVLFIRHVLTWSTIVFVGWAGCGLLISAYF